MNGLIYLAVPYVCYADNVMPGKLFAPRKNKNLTEIIYKLADYRTFRKDFNYLDVLLNDACQVDSRVKDDYGIYSYYKCDADTEIEKMSFSYLFDDGKGKGYLLTLHITYDCRNYETVRKIVSARLGKESYNYPKSLSWLYSSDKMLNQRGDPIIEVSCDADTNRASFGLGIHSGP